MNGPLGLAGQTGWWGRQQRWVPWA